MSSQRELGEGTDGTTTENTNARLRPRVPPAPVAPAVPQYKSARLRARGRPFVGEMRDRSGEDTDHDDGRRAGEVAQEGQRLASGSGARPPTLGSVKQTDVATDPQLISEVNFGDLIEALDRERSKLYSQLGIQANARLLSKTTVPAKQAADGAEREDREGMGHEKRGKKRKRADPSAPRDTSATGHAHHTSSSSRPQSDAATHAQPRKHKHRTTGISGSPSSPLPAGSASGPATSSSLGAPSSAAIKATQSPANVLSQARTRLEASEVPGSSPMTRSEAVPIPLPSHGRLPQQVLSTGSASSARPTSSSQLQSHPAPSRDTASGLVGRSTAEATFRSTSVQAAQNELEVPSPPAGMVRIQPTSPSQANPSPSLAELALPPPDARSKDFWYLDGNVIVVVEGTSFRLLQSRLERHCVYFTDKPTSTANGQKVFVVQDLKLADFETFLRYLEIPMEHSVKEASKDVAMSLLRASRVLSCKVIGDLAAARVFGLWSCASIPASGDALRGRPYNEAIAMLGVARDFNAAMVQKQTLYALLADEQFWSDVVSRRAEVDIPDADLLLLYRTRAALQEMWRILILTPPNACEDSGCIPDAETRETLWSGQTAKYATTEVPDTIRSLEGVRTAVKQLSSWCRACLDERARALEDARGLWWKELDRLLGIVMPAEARA